MSDKNLASKLQNAVEFSEEGLDKGYSMELEDRRSCYVSRDEKVLRLFLECGCEDFRDRFSGIEVRSTVQAEVGKEVKHGISMTCPKEYRRQFVILAKDLINYDHRIEGSLDIQSWCDEWKNIFGNKYSENRIYDVLAEMLVCSYLSDSGMSPDWVGPLGGSHDILCDSFDCEVKSTTNRTGSLTIQSSSGIQLQRGNKPLRLFVCRFEECSNGELSIDYLRRDLLSKGFDLVDLSNKLDAVGMNTSKYQKTKFKLIENMRLYEVDENFPSIRDLDFVGGKIPDHIVNVRYSLDLEGIPYQSVSVDASSSVPSYGDIENEI